MKLAHRCTGPSKEDPYACGVWINLRFGWLRVWPLRRNVCLGWWASAKEWPTGQSEAKILLNLKEL